MNRQELLLLTTTAVGAAIFGFLVGDRESEPAPPRSTLSQAEPESLQPLLEEIRKLGGLMSVLARPAAVRETADRTALGDGEEIASAPDMVELLERCSALIERMEQRGSTSASQTNSLFFDSPSATSENLNQFPETLEGEKAFLAKHQLWSFQQVLDRYGRPNEINVHDNEIVWRYMVTRPEGETVGWNFIFVEGLVYRTDIW